MKKSFFTCIVFACLACGNNNPAANDTGTQTNPEEVEVLEEQPRENENWQEERNQGYDFVAFGTKPDWTLLIDWEGETQLISPKLIDTLKIHLAKAIENKDPKLTFYEQTTNDKHMALRIYQSDCANSGANVELPYGVSVLAKADTMQHPKEHQGCGFYLGDARLHGTWQLQKWRGGVVSTEAFLGQNAGLAINLDDFTVSGFGGCNQVNSSVTFGRDQINFSHFRSTKIACDALDFESAFVAALNDASYTYQFKGDQLTLRNSEENLIFTRAKTLVKSH